MADHLIQPIFIGAPVFALKCFTRGNAGVFFSGIMSHENWRTEMFQDNPLDPGFSLFEEEDKIIYEDGESNSGIIFGITCVASFSISFEAIGGSVDPSIWTDVNLVIFRNNELVIDEGARIFAGTQAGSVFERITVGLGDSEACNLLVYIEFVKAPDSGGVDLECYFNATD